MKTLILVLGLVSACLLWTGCSKSENGPDKPGGGGTEIVQKIPLAISTTITKVLNDSFEEGDAIGLYVVNALSNGSSGWNSGSLMNTGNHLSNVKFSYESGVWKSQQEYYWKDASTPADFYCYYPHTGSVADVSAVPFAIKADQSSGENYRSCEILWGKSSLQFPSKNKVNITVTHRMSQIQITILPGKGFTAETLRESLESVKINNLECNALLNLKDGALTANGNSADITPYYDGTLYRALIVPQSVENKTLITLIVDEMTRSLTQSIEFTSGTIKKCTITVDKLSEGINIGISGWETDNEDYGGTLN